MTVKIRVLIVDDSAFTRKVVREILEADARFEVVGIARDGLEALEKIEQLKPDVVTLDLVMPNLDGVGVLRALPARGAPRVVIVSISDADTELGAEALQLGAVDLVRKPTALATAQLYEISRELVDKVAVAGNVATPILALPPVAPVEGPARASEPRVATKRLIVLGTSTGGPQAITRVLEALPADLPVPVAIALHIPAGYTEALARRLDERSPLTVREAREGLVLEAGMVVLAQGGAHLTLERDGGRALVHVGAPRAREIYTPSVNLLFESAAASFGSEVLAVVLTGMGDDGLRGAQAVHAAGGVVLTETEASCVVYGMPRVVKEAGISAGEASIERMAAEILRRSTR